MRNIEIDEDVYGFIQARAIPYEDQRPNDTLRRIFGLDPSVRNDEELDKVPSHNQSSDQRGDKATEASRPSRVRLSVDGDDSRTERQTR